MADSIDARITADILNDLRKIRTENLYNTNITNVEEKRSILKIKHDSDTATFALLELLPPDIDDDYQHTQDGTLQYMLFYFNGQDDETGDPIQYTDRNVAADVTYALMRDRSRGNLAQNTEIKTYGHGYYYQQGTVDIPIICTWVMIEVKRLINADNPYELA